MWWHVLLGVAAGLVALWLVLLVILWRAAPDRARLGEALRLLPDVLRLLRRLAADPQLPRGVRIRLVLLLAYLVSPIDLIPDVVPVLGYADDVVVIVLALRSVARHAGTQALHRHWPGSPGSPDGLARVERLAGIPQHE